MKREAKSGFTLIEVTFALLLMSLGLFAIFHLFPSGLRASVDANAFTRQAMFAEDCFGAIRAEAAEASADPDADWAQIFSSGQMFELSDGVTRVTASDDDDWSEAIIYPESSNSDVAKEYLRYRLTLDVKPPVLGTVEVEVRDGRMGTRGDTFYTEVYDYGM